jgi:hypothetical protein
MTNKHNFTIYQPRPEARADGLTLWSVDLAAGLLWLVTIALLVAFLWVAVS